MLGSSGDRRAHTQAWRGEGGGDVLVVAQDVAVIIVHLPRDRGLSVLLLRSIFRDSPMQDVLVCVLPRQQEVSGG